LGWSKKKIQETDPWDTVVVDNSYPLSFFRNQLAEVIKKSGNVSRQKGSRRINFEEIEQSDKFVTMTQSSIHSLFPSLQPNKKRRLNNSDFEWSETKKQNSEFNRKKNKKRKKSHKIRTKS
jgi:protein-tyrosine-phosphatase